MRTFKSGLIFCLIIVLALGFGTAGRVLGQDYATGVKTLIFLDRGIVWDSWTGNCHGLEANFAWFSKMMDYPGFEPATIKANIGDWPTHNYGSSWGFAALRTPGIWPGKDPHPDIDILGAEPQQGQGLTVNTSFTDTSQSIVQQVSNHRWLAGENYYLKKNPLEAEEIIDSWQSWNPNYKWSPLTTEVNRHFLPVKKTYKLMLWTGSQQDQRYQIEELTIKNISDDPAMSWSQNITLYDFYVMKNHYVSINRRSWLLMSGTTGGVSKDEQYTWDTQRNMMILWDGDWRDPVSSKDDTYDFVSGVGPNKQGEWAAGGHVGIGFLYSSPNKFGVENNTVNYWNAICNNPGMGTDSPYQGVNNYLIVADGKRTAFYLQPGHKDYGNAIYNQHIVAGPWDIAPGQEIKVVSFQGVGGVDLEVQMNLTKLATQAEIATGMDSIKMLWDKAKLTAMMAEKEGYATGGTQYKGWNHPDPPACPYDFTLAPYRGDDAAIGDVPGNIISWGDWADSKADPDYTGDEAIDLDSYTVWKSEYLPMMGWKPMATIKKQAASNYNATSKTYKYVDTQVNIGFSYYYALSTTDKGHTTWPPRPEAIAEYPTVFPGGKVPPLQSGIQASLNYTLDKTKWVAFRTQRNPGRSLDKVRVFPNPFVIAAGFINPGETDGIHFVNIPADCEIRIYTIRGDLIATGPGSIEMRQEAGSGEAVWRQLTASEQFPESGMYFWTLKVKSGTLAGQTTSGKFVIIR